MSERLKHFKKLNLLQFQVECMRCHIADNMQGTMQCGAGWENRNDHRVQGADHENTLFLVATQDPIKKDGRADLFLDPPCCANPPRRQIG